MNILLGLTGSVASSLSQKLITELQKLGHVKVVVTERSKHFFKIFDKPYPPGFNECDCYDDSNEWPVEQYEKGDEILHIKLRQWADVLVLAPLSANTLAKIANGIADNLLTSIVRAWDFKKSMVIAPAMNTYMWKHPCTTTHIDIIRNWFCDPVFDLVKPIEKDLPCGEKGIGALAKIDDIIWSVERVTRWHFPLFYCRGVPIGTHLGSFGVKRHNTHHTGVDLYSIDNYIVKAMEAGVVVSVQKFTGPQVGTPHWNDTDALLIEGPSGVICYGEIATDLKVGDKVGRGDNIARVKQVLHDDKYRPDIPCHSMLHVELYKHGVRKTPDPWKIGSEKVDWLLDPTPRLLNAFGSPGILQIPLS